MIEREDVLLPRRMLSLRRARNEAGEPAVMVHGLGGSSLNWRDFAAEMSDRLDSYVPDLPGFGWSPPPRDGVMTPLGHARAVVDLIDWIGRGPVHLFGNSMGGAVAVQIAARRPDLVRSLTLLAPALPTLRASRDAVVLPVLALPGVGELLMPRMTQQTAEQRVRAVVELCVGNPELVPPDRLEEMIDDARAREHLPYAADAMLRSLRGLLGSYLETGPNRPWKLAERVVAPTLVVYGQRDRLVDARAAHRVTRHFRDAHVLVLPESGHVPQIEHPAWVGAAWREHLGRRRDLAEA